jgi:hypothetical protein
VMEVGAMASDLTGFIGATVGFNLLFGIPLWTAGLLTGAATLIILGLEGNTWAHATPTAGSSGTNDIIFSTGSGRLTWATGQHNP